MARPRRPEFDPNHRNDWFPVFGEIAGSVYHPSKTGWSVWSNPKPHPELEECAHIIKICGPMGLEYKIDLTRWPRDGKFQDIFLDGQPLPVRIGWYSGGQHKGYNKAGQWVTWTAPAGYYGQWT